ncbi:hypothetical protein [Cuneatibacter caecimuris]|uniref:Alternate signal-mediated exported protein n=1 Tax=Cuneatibacter caecimuris TaxID=1796618 RepID=A0A4Q7PKW3_9FIRM|nr:hypothetical protein [Cuneatibacter caecimuris]RZT01185.1 alternate signal-mediated exported protein [Cuneatibacter caecimuris]
MGKKMCKRLALALLTVVCVGLAVLLVRDTYSYLTSKNAAANDFIIAQDTITIEEEFTPPPDIKAGDVITKKPSIKNTGNIPLFVRMRAEFSLSDIAKLCEPLTISESWYYSEADSFYYYKHVLYPGEITEPLFTQVVIKDTAPAEKLTPFDIIVYGESKDLGGYSGNETSDTGFVEKWDEE